MNSVNNSKSNKPLILIGAGGHAKVLLSIIQSTGLSVLGVCAPELAKQGITSWRGHAVLNTVDDNLGSYSPDQVNLVNGVGNIAIRQRLFEQFKTQGYEFPKLIHPHACIDSSAKLDEGVQIMAGAIIQTDACIGKNVIINTRASVDHDCIIEDHVHIAPGATVCGYVHIKKSVFIASGTTIADWIKIGEGAVAGAGVSIVRDILPGQIILPAPIRITTRTNIPDKSTV